MDVGMLLPPVTQEKNMCVGLGDEVGRCHELRLLRSAALWFVSKSSS